MTNGNHITDTGLLYIGMYCPSLEALHAPWCRKLSGVGLAHVNQGCRNLSVVDLMGNKLITVDAIFNLVAQSDGPSQITYLNLSGCDKLNDEALAHIGHYCKCKFLLLI